MELFFFGRDQASMGFFELLNDGDVLGALFQATAALLALGGVVLAGNEPFVGIFGSSVEFIDSEFVHEAKDYRYVDVMLTGQAVLAAGAVEVGELFLGLDHGFDLLAFGGAERFSGAGGLDVLGELLRGAHARKGYVDVLIVPDEAEAGDGFATGTFE